MHLNRNIVVFQLNMPLAHLILQNKKRDASPNTPLDSNKQTKLLEPILFN